MDSRKVFTPLSMDLHIFEYTWNLTISGGCPSVCSTSMRVANEIKLQTRGKIAVKSLVAEILRLNYVKILFRKQNCATNNYQKIIKVSNYV